MPQIFQSFFYELSISSRGYRVWLRAGQEACLKAAKAGLRTLLVEERTLGNTSFHAGGYAVRALRACASYFKQTKNAAKVGTSLDLIETSWTSWLTAQRKNSSQLSNEFGNALEREKVDLKLGRARLIGPTRLSSSILQGALI